MQSSPSKTSGRGGRAGKWAGCRWVGGQAERVCLDYVGCLKAARARLCFVNICISCRLSGPSTAPFARHLLERRLAACSRANLDAMDRSSKLADLTLVSKYYPVANYSYPRNETMRRSGGYTGYTGYTMSPSDRLSVGSESSAPGLDDDRTDSEASGDDDECQYRSLAAEIWDSFWQLDNEEAKKGDEPETQPRKHYPALIPSPQRRRQHSAEDIGQRGRTPGWPLPESPHTRKLRERQPAATYSPFPRPIALPPPGKPATPSWQCSRSRQQPPRPPRPDEKLLTPCIPQEPTHVTAVFTSCVLPEDPADTRGSTRGSTRRSGGPWSAPLLERKSASSEEPRRHSRTSSLVRRLPIAAEMQRPKTSHSSSPPTPPTPPTPTEPRRPKSSRSLRPRSPTDLSRPKTSQGSRPSTPFEPESPTLFSLATCLPMPDISKNPGRKRMTPKPELRSFFDDSDCEDDDKEEEGSRSFFRFHKRSTSDLRRSAQSSEEAPRRHRGCTTSGPTSSTGYPHNPEKKLRGADMFGRMLGRRSR